MKKSLIALAALAAVTAASAQSTTTISGTYGGAQQSYTAAGVKTKGVAVTDSSVKVDAVEDLGGGLKASFAMQFTMGNERGASSTNGLTKEDSSVALAGPFGTVAFTNTRTSDTGISAMVFSSWLPRTAWYDTVSARAASDIASYNSPELVPGLRVGVAQASVAYTGVGVLCNSDGLSNSGTAASSGACVAANTQTGYKANILSVSYSNGPLAIMGAQKSTNLSSSLVALGMKKGNSELAATYDFGMAKVGLAYDSKTTNTGSALIGYSVNVPVGALAVGFNTASRGDNKYIDYGVNYSLSKRTTLAAQAGKLSGTVSNSASTSTIGNQYRLGVKHTF